jgi:hypothetical protein
LYLLYSPHRFSSLCTPSYFLYCHSPLLCFSPLLCLRNWIREPVPF